MRFVLMFVAFAGIGLSGCGPGGDSSHRLMPNTFVTSQRSAGYMTPEQSAALITMPGDSTTAVQMQYLSHSSRNDDSSPPAADPLQQ
jgi:hypothetical protein